MYLSYHPTFETVNSAVSKCPINKYLLSQHTQFIIHTVNTRSFITCTTNIFTHYSFNKQMHSLLIQFTTVAQRPPLLTTHRYAHSRLTDMFITYKSQICSLKTHRYIHYLQFLICSFKLTAKHKLTHTCLMSFVVSVAQMERLVALLPLCGNI